MSFCRFRQGFRYGDSVPFTRDIRSSNPLYQNSKLLQSGISAVATIPTYYILLGYIDRYASSPNHEHRYLDSHKQRQPSRPLNRQPYDQVFPFQQLLRRALLMRRERDQQCPCSDDPRRIAFLHRVKEEDQRPSDPRSVLLTGAGPERLTEGTPADNRA
jgi:hypothetical protein